MSYKFNPFTGKMDIVETDHTKLSNIGTNTHPQIDTFIGGTGYTKTTAGQTINVSTAAELTAALAGLAAAPSFLGNVTIQLAAGTYTGAFQIPTLIYNGFSLTILGSLSETNLGNSSSSVASVAGTSYAYVEKTGAGWTANAYRYQLLRDSSKAEYYVPIFTNDTTKIYTGSELAMSGSPIKVYNFATIINGRFYSSAYSSVNLRFLKINNVVGDPNSTIIIQFGSIWNIQNCFLISTSGGIGLYVTDMSYVTFLANIIFSDTNPMRIENNSTLYNRETPLYAYQSRAKQNLIRLTDTQLGGKTGVNVISFSQAILFPCSLIIADSLQAGSEGVFVDTVSNVVDYGTFLENFTLGEYAVRHSFIYSVSTKFTNCTTNKTPAAATDPSYIS